MMSRFREWSVFLALLGIILVLPTAAQAQRDLPDVLSRALQLVDMEMYEVALEEAEIYLQEGLDDKFAAAALVIAGRCEVNLGHGAKALERGYTVLDTWGVDNPMAAQAWFLIATAQQELGDEYEAARALVHCLDADPEPSMRQLALGHLSELVQGPVAYRADALRRLARKEGTKQTLEVMLPKSATHPTFGLLVPESEEVNDPGRQLIEGFQAALSRWNLTQGLEADVVIRRVPKGGPYAVHAARTLAREVGVWGMVIGGPEEMVIPAVVEAQAAGVPVVLPGLRRPGLDALGPDVLLPEADWHTEGKLAAAYATDSLGMKTFGIVAPFTDLGRELVAGFREVLDERDTVEVLSLEWYFPEEGVSLARQFQRLRTIGFRREFRDSLRLSNELPQPDSVIAMLDTLDLEGRITLLDSLKYDTEAFSGLLAPTDSLLALVDSTSGRSIVEFKLDSLLSRIDSVRFERHWSTHLDSIKRTLAYKAGQIDSNDIELDVFDALYLPIEPGTIPLFAPQFAFYAFKTTKLGNAIWYNPDELYRNRQYVENMIFTAPYRLDALDGEMGELRMYLDSAGVRPVTPWHIRGYDSGNILLEAVSGGRTGAGELAEGLHQLDSLSLSAGPQEFSDNSQVGNRMWLLTSQMGRVNPEDVNARRLLLHPVELDSATADSLERAQPEIEKAY
ncbi:hypothetical protein KQI63_11655 [bacterium]|nr:hypothetical protein [bacterium]